MNKIVIVSLFLGLFLVTSVSASSTFKSINFFYSETCPHCKIVYPLVTKLSQDFTINFLDVSKGSYNIKGVPLIKILTSDNREISLVGSYEIPKYLECELNEMSTKECPTYSITEGYNCSTQSWFIR
jgi:thiol-disulfide isomerase/thioredoxin